jgi:hypothetical protein
MSDKFTPLFADAAPKRQTFTEKVMSKAPVSFGTDDLGNPVVGVGIPGYGGCGAGGAMLLRPENMQNFCTAIRNAVDGVGPDPLQVAVETMTRTGEGEISFKLSHMPRSQTITMSSAEAIEFATLVERMITACEKKAQGPETDGEEATDGE